MIDTGRKRTRYTPKDLDKIGPSFGEQLRKRDETLQRDFRRMKDPWSDLGRGLSLFKGIGGKKRKK
ncbi:MAG: hypothetical protein JRD89_01350 [Deltaproteobacteria bacterium]|nr:hypothetical protein [Deltaproteobacteria bacterium]